MYYKMMQNKFEMSAAWHGDKADQLLKGGVDNYEDLMKMKEHRAEEMYNNDMARKYSLIVENQKKEQAATRSRNKSRGLAKLLGL